MRAVFDQKLDEHHRHAANPPSVVRECGFALGLLKIGMQQCLLHKLKKMGQKSGQSGGCARDHGLFGRVPAMQDVTIVVAARLEHAKQFRRCAVNTGQRREPVLQIFLKRKFGIDDTLR